MSEKSLETFHKRLAHKQLVINQIQEFLDTGKITCDCGEVFSILELYKCLYCSAYACLKCSEEHFGKTRGKASTERGFSFFLVTGT